MSTQIWEFLGSLSPFPGLSTFGWPYTSLCPCGHKAGIIWNIATCEQCTLKGKRTNFVVNQILLQLFLFENKVKNIRMKTIFEMNSLHYVPYIFYWVHAEWKFYIQTNCQIIRVNFTNMVAKFFFPSGRPHFANHPLFYCPHLSTFTWPPSSPVS